MKCIEMSWSSGDPICQPPSTMLAIIWGVNQTVPEAKKTPTLHCGAKGSLTSFPKKCYTAEQHHVRREVQSKGCLPANSDVSDGVRCPLKEERMHGFHVIGNF